MKTGSLCALVAILSCGGWVVACSNSDGAPAASPDASAGGSVASGGKTGTGGTTSSTGGKTAVGTGGVSDSGSPETGAGDSGPSSGGSPATGGTTGATGGKTGAADAGDAGCKRGNFPCQTPYPTVQYPPENQATDKKAMLGKILFWEEEIGDTHEQACGSCHRAYSGGSDPRTLDPAAALKGPDNAFETQPSETSDDIRGAQGVPPCTHGATDGGVLARAKQVTSRKPPSYFDAMFAARVFWDGRAGDCKNATDGTQGGCFYDPDTGALLIHGVQFNQGLNLTAGGALEAQASGPPVSDKEMACKGETWADIAARLKGLTPLTHANSIPPDIKAYIAGRTYPQIFADVYGKNDKVSAADSDDVINTRRIVFAIATHERRLTSNQTPWDKWNAGDDTAMTAAQIRGFNVFMGAGKCGICHPPPLFTDNAFHFIGFHDPSWDVGRAAQTASDLDKGKFKTPTLRNVGLRAQFGLTHSGDGPGHDLDTVLSLYKQGGRRASFSTIDVIMEGPLAINSSDIADLKDFLANGLTDPRVKDELAPFDRPHLSSEP
jgi:cytochrome c peroxidase